MALWEKTRKLPLEFFQKINSVYGDHFPIEVRHFLAAWIEERLWTNIESNNPQFETYIGSLVISLIQKLESTAASLMETPKLSLSAMKLTETAEIFRQKYLHNPDELYRVMCHCLKTEMHVLQQFENPGRVPTEAMSTQEPPAPRGSTRGITQEIETLQRGTRQTDYDLRNIEQGHERLSLIDHERSKVDAAMENLRNDPPRSTHNGDSMDKLQRKKNHYNQLFNAKALAFLQLQRSFEDKLQDRISSLRILQSRVLDVELIRWKRNQQLIGIGATFECKLDAIQEWCDALAELIWLNRQQIKVAQRLKENSQWHSNTPDILPSLNEQITQLLSSLVTSTFIVNDQPPQVLKTNTRFASTVKLLVGGKLNVHMTPPQVKVSIISEAQATAMLKSDKIAKNGETSGEILNNMGTMEYHQATKQLSVSFRNMQLKKIKRTEKKGTESVMDEKFALLFQSQFSVGGGELTYQVWTLSLPVVVIVHGNQEPHAWATITWDNAFAEEGRVPFVVSEKVPWSQVAEALNIKFKKATGRALSEDNLRFLGEKAFQGGYTGYDQDYSNLLLSWGQFCKDPLPDRNFTFWEWFYAVMKLTKEHLKGPWVDGHILGFIRKKSTEAILANCPSGTFLMRFSDSELGGITIAWVGERHEVFMLQPFTSKDFAVRSLADRISDLPPLISLYPDTPKDVVFTKYYTRIADDELVCHNGYVKPVLMTHVPGWGSYRSGDRTPSQCSVTAVARNTPSAASSYARGLGQSNFGGGHFNNVDSDRSLMNYCSNLPSVDGNFNLDQLNGFNYPTVDFTQPSNSQFV